MAQRRDSDPSTTSPAVARAVTIERLCRLPGIEDLSYLGYRTVSAIRLMAICGKAERDPLVELTRRFGSVTAAKAFLDFADLAGACWPERLAVMRPCCRIISHDEATLAAMADCAGRGDRTGFEAVLTGFVRPDRHERLFSSAAQAMAELR